MKKKANKKAKAFTLIELLSVILILGIIALIAVPVVNSVIDDAKKSSTLRSAEQYIEAVEQAIAVQEMKGDVLTGTKQVDDLKDYVELKGTLPSSGTLTIENNTVIDCTLQVGDYIVTCDNGVLAIIKEEEDNIAYLTKDMFEDEDTLWGDIIASVKAGKYDNTSTSELIGAERELVVSTHTNDCETYLGTGSNYVCNSSEISEQSLTIRIANVTDCIDEIESKTACGFVIEFVDIIDKHNMNPANSSYDKGFNIGSWPQTAMRTYLNNTILNALPNDIKNNIIDTTVVTGHESVVSTNYVSTDKLYLLSTAEIWAQGTSEPNSYDTGRETTRQLDYYEKIGVTVSNYSLSIKKYKGKNTYWWLRVPRSTSTTAFNCTRSGGDWNHAYALEPLGVAPAFRLK